MKKRVTTLLLTGVLMVMSSVPTMAAVARVPIGPCPKCGVQACSTTESTGYEHDELFACKHGKSGYPMRRKTPCFSYGDIRRVHRIYASN